MRSHNIDVNPELMAAWDDPEQQPRLLHLFAFDKNDNVIGGLLGETQFAWCKVHIIAVDKGLRRTGIGGELLQRAEAEAVARGCKYVYLDSMEYHAPKFYYARGYECAGTISDWDSRGHTKYSFTKVLER